MTFTRLKNLGLLSLILILALICSAAFVQTRNVTGILSDVEERLLPAMGVIYPIELLLADANEGFHGYHEERRITELDLQKALTALGDSVAGLKRLMTSTPQVLSTYQRGIQSAADEFLTLAELVNSEGSRGNRTSRQEAVAESALADLRTQLRLLANEVDPTYRPASRPILRKASRLLRIAEQNLSIYAAQGPSPVSEVLDLLFAADSRLGDLLDLGLSRRLQDEILQLRGTLKGIETAIYGYLDDQQTTRGDASSDTLNVAHERIHDLWQKAMVSGTWITRNLHREVWLSTEAAATTSRQGQGALLILGLVGIIVATATAWLLSRSLGRHVVQISEATGKFAAGDYSKHLPAQGGDDMARLEVSLNQMADKLQAREVDLARLAAAVEHTADGVLIATAGGVVEYVNPAFAQITGMSADQLLGQNLGNPRGAAPTGGRGHHIQHVVTTGRPWTGRRAARRGDDTEYHELLSISPILDSDGEVERLALMVRDITRDVQIEERVKESQKLQALGTLAGGIAHDFNNLLVPIICYSEMLLARTQEQDPAHRKLQRVAGAAERAKELVEQVLTFSRAGEKKKAPLQLAPLVKEVVKLVGINLPGNITVNHLVEPGLPPVLGDPVQIHQALMNLLTNAAHAMESGGGALEIRLEHGRSGLGSDNSDGLCLTIQDTGCGMSPEVQSRIFEPFYTTKGVGKGTGLGLSVVHGIMEDHGGTIQVESQLGVGTQFHLFFPATAARMRPAREPAEPPQQGSERILLVEDEPPVAEVLQAALEERGYRVTTTDRAVKALELLATPGAEFELVLTDQRMPGMSGTELIAALREDRPGLPVMLCTGHFGESGDLTPETSGASAVIFKPVHPDDLGRAVRGVLDQGMTIG